MEVIEGLDVLVLRGSAQDVEADDGDRAVYRAVHGNTEPAIDIMPMKHLRKRLHGHRWSRPCTTKSTCRGRAP